MIRITFPWRKAAYAVLLGAILFLTILPYFGFAWHRVLPEHTHLYFGAPHDDSADEPQLTATASTVQPDMPPTGTETQMRSGVLHLPDEVIAQILSLAIGAAALFALCLPPDFPRRLLPLLPLYRNPIVSPLDPPPTPI
jgi:hypothetical protein